MYASAPTPCEPTRLCQQLWSGTTGVLTPGSGWGDLDGLGGAGDREWPVRVGSVGWLRLQPGILFGNHVAMGTDILRPACAADQNAQR